MRTVRPLFQLIRSYPQNTTRIPGPLEPHTSGKPERIRISLTEIPHQCPQRLALQRGPITRHHFQHASEERCPAEIAQDSLNCELAPNSLLTDGSRHSPARKQPPERSTDMHPPRRRERSQPPSNTSDPHHSRTRIPLGALTLVAKNLAALGGPRYHYPRKDTPCPTTASHIYSSSHPKWRTSKTC